MDTKVERNEHVNRMEDMAKIAGDKSALGRRRPTKKRCDDITGR